MLNLRFAFVRGQVFLTPVASMGSFGPRSIDELHRLRAPKNFDHIILPEQRRLKFVPKTPIVAGQTKVQPSKKRLCDMRGPELVQNELLHKQYGVAAVLGGRMEHRHFETVRQFINRHMDEKRMYAVWRVEPPWKPVTKHPQGTTMGGGKGDIDYYVTPIRAGRVIFELCGKCEYDEVYWMLLAISSNMPFKARPISQEMLEHEAKIEEIVEKNNVNPITWKYALKNNLLGANVFASPWDFAHGPKHR